MTVDDHVFPSRTRQIYRETGEVFIVEEGPY
jgi:hypothetical protein